jgi:hypothetical protein
MAKVKEKNRCKLLYKQQMKRCDSRVIQVTWGGDSERKKTKRK